MAGKILQVPQGLLSLLGLKEQGRNPDVLSDTVIPDIDLTDLWLQRLMVNELDPFSPPVSFAASTQGQANFLTAGANPAQIPTNEMWYVYQMQVGGSLLAAEYIRLAPMLIPQFNVGQNQLVGLDYNDVITARARSFCAFAQRPFWAPPGAVFGLRIFDIVTAASITCTLGLRVARLKI